MDFWSLAPLRWQDLIDILLLSFLFYRILLLIKGTRTIPMLMGMIILLVLYLVARFLQLDATGLLMDNLANSLVLVLVVLFQADIRNALAQFRRKWGSEILLTVGRQLTALSAKAFY
ncbi:MAG: hypothetical protein RL242_1654 [Pseudomonadota bacterium]